MTRDDLETVSTAVALSTAACALLYRLTWPHFRERVFRALDEEQPRFQAWNARYWQPRIEEWSMGAHTAGETQQELLHLVDQFKEFRLQFDSRMEQFILIGQAVVDLRKGIHDLNDTLRAIRDDHNNIRTDVAVLKARMHGRGA